MKRKIVLSVLLALALAACTPASPEPESVSEPPSAPSSQTEELPAEPSEPESASAETEESSAPEVQGPRTLPDWADEAFYSAAEDWAWGERTSASMLESYEDLVASDHLFQLTLKDGTLSGWVELDRDETVPETVPVEMLYQNSARLEAFRENCRAGKPDQVVCLSSGRPLLYGLTVYTFDGETLWQEYLTPMGADHPESVALTEAELIEGDGWWQIRPAESGSGLIVPEEPLPRLTRDLEEVLRQAEEAGYIIEQTPADRNGIPCTHYYFWNEERNVLHASFYVAEDDSCWFDGDEVNGNTWLMIGYTPDTGEED